MVGRRERGIAHSVERDGRNSIQAGLVAMALLGGTMATFGPSFHLALGYALLSSAFVAAALALVWADRVGHSRTLIRRTRRNARSGQILSGIALMLILYYTAAWILLVIAGPLIVAAGLIVWSLHRSRIDHDIAAREVRL